MRSFGVSVPEFVTAMVVLVTLGNQSLNLLPVTGCVPFAEGFWDGLAHLVLPVLTVSVILVAPWPGWSGRSSSTCSAPTTYGRRE